MIRRLALLAALAGCPTAGSGTIDLSLTQAPGSALLDGVTRLRVTLTNPRTVVEATRGADGFALALEVDANGEPGALVVDGFDATDALVAVGQSPEFGVAAIDARIAVYMSAPYGLAAAPVSLLPPRANVSGGTLPYGAIFVGGRDPAGAASDAVAIYNAYDHSLVGGRALPAPREGITVAPGPNGVVYLFGGLDTAGNPTGTAWLFDSNFAPAGAYLELGDFPGFARANEVAIATSADRFVVTGAPPVDLAGTGVSARSDVPALASAGATFVTATGVRTALALDATGRLVRYHEGAFELLAPSRPGAALAALRDGKLLAVGGGTAEEANDILVVDAFGGVTTIADALTTERTNARVAVTRRHVVVVGGGPTEILDAATLARVVEPRERIDGKPFPLPNDQVLIVDDATGALVLFTPPGV